MRMRLALIAVLPTVAIIASSCAGLSAYNYRQFYVMVSPVKNYDGVYEDNTTLFQFDITEKKVNVLITNKGKEPMEVQWAKAQFIDQQGAKHEVANIQTLLSREQSKIMSTDIPSGTTETNVIVPADNQEELEQWTWYIKPFFGQTDESAKKNVGKSFVVVLPIKVGNEEREYSFQFMVTAVVPYKGYTPG
jgi:hypothetical protein